MWLLWFPSVSLWGVFDLFWLYRFSGCGTSCVMTPDPSSFVSQCTVLQAPVLLRNLSDHNVNVSNSVTLRCPARGIPHPRITWYKDQRKLQQVSGETRKCVLSIFILYVNILHMFFFYWQVLCCFQRKGLCILTELQLKTRDFTPVRPPMREGLWRAPPTFGFKVSYCFVLCLKTWE